MSTYSGAERFAGTSHAKGHLIPSVVLGFPRLEVGCSDRSGRSGQRPLELEQRKSNG